MDKTDVLIARILFATVLVLLAAAMYAELTYGATPDNYEQNAPLYDSSKFENSFGAGAIIEPGKPMPDMDIRREQLSDGDQDSQWNAPSSGTILGGDFDPSRAFEGSLYNSLGDEFNRSTW